ncbi:hypothetical protein D4764_05G0001380 [Takifugu flavidus]|uniref:Uncharacterized protein n=1 Tax=Takifugu flavidus TaxID=433684 RepID=A0A5C6N020_9TELE|nr:hypothetical protein D4764_05G0001380 [Takifugu flavidus]
MRGDNQTLFNCHSETQQLRGMGCVTLTLKTTHLDIAPSQVAAAPPGGLARTN